MLRNASVVEVKNLQKNKHVRSINSWWIVKPQAALELSPNTNELQNLCRHPLYMQTRFNEETNTFSNGTFHCGGLLKRLKLRFYPTYAYKRNRSPFWGKGVKSSKAIGSRVDREVEQLVNIDGIRSIDDPAFPRHVSVKTKRFFRRLKEKDITPVFAEFPVVCVGKGVGTRIDLIAYRHFGLPTQRIVTIERKTGYASGLFRAQGVMEAPLGHVKNNPFNQHQLQSLVGALMLKNSYGLKISEMYVLYTDLPKNYWQKLPVEFQQPRDLALHVWNHLSKQQQPSAEKLIRHMQ